MKDKLFSVLTDSTFTLNSERSRIALQQVKELTQILLDPKSQQTFDEFATELLDVLQTTFDETSGGTGSIQRERLWQSFHHVRISNDKVIGLWEKLLRSLKVTIDPIVQQYVVQKLYEDIISKSRYCCTNPSAIAAASSVINNITPDEENVVRYAAGYVPMVLMKKHQKNASDKSASFVECLSTMAINGEESTLLDYTTHWIAKVNRGGLFEVNDTTYLLFREIEMNLRGQLLKTLQPSISTAHVQLDKKDELVTSVMQDDNVLYYWALLSIDIAGDIITVGHRPNSDQLAHVTAHVAI